VAQSIFEKDFNGVLVRDRYAAYSRIGRDWQACLADISRNAKDIDKEHALLPQSKQHPNVKIFVTEIRKLCFGACSQSGLEVHSVLPSLVITAKRQGVDLRWTPESRQ
jgi:hypothetical protein